MSVVKHAEQHIGVNPSSASLSPNGGASVFEFQEGRILDHRALTRHPLYSTYRQMLHRCLNPKSTSFRDYGARGITVCERWQESFWNFVEDMGHRPPGLSIDRINNDGNYEPGNCRWATPQEQADNSRKPIHPPRGPQRYIPPSKTVALTPAQESALHALVEAGSHDGAAKALNISARTIKAHAGEIFKRTGCESQLQLGIWYAKHFPERCA